MKCHNIFTLDENRDEPKKPDLKTENKMSFYVCESCGNKVFKGMNVCDECGQRLNWED